MKVWLLVLVLAGCASQETPSSRELEKLLTELQPQVTQVLGVKPHDPWPIRGCPYLRAPLSALRVDGESKGLYYRDDWQADLDSSYQRHAVAHELVHLLGPDLQSYALMEGLADLMALDVVPVLRSTIWAFHWTVLIKAPDSTVPWDLLLQQRPEAEDEATELRALGFLALFVLPRDQLERVCKGQLTAAQVFSSRTWATVPDLLKQAMELCPGP